VATQLEKALDAALERLARPSGMIGHNAPLTEFRLTLTDDDIARLRESIVAVHSELNKSDAITTADTGTLIEARDRFTGLGSRLGGFGKWAGIAVGAAILGGLGKEVGEQIWTETPFLPVLVHSITETLSAWIHAIVALL
jgi:hypothetical protein